MKIGKLPKRVVIAGLLLLFVIGTSAGLVSMTSTKAVAVGRDGDPHAGKIGCGILRQLSAEYDMLQSGQVPVSQDRRGLAAAPTTWAQLLKKYKHIQIDAKKRVLVNARVTLMEHYDGFKNELRDLGMDVTVTAPKQGLVIGYLPIDRVAELPKLAHFSSASAV